MITGQTIKLIVKAKSGIDAIGNSVFTEETIDAENILIEPTGAQEVTDTLNLYGRKAKYTLHIPKGDANNWESTEVLFYGERWRTIGKPTEYMTNLTPGAWNKKVPVESETETEEDTETDG